MTFWKIVTLACSASMIVDAKWLQHQKRDIPSNICDTLFNSTNKVQCYCIKDHKDPPVIKSAECYLTTQAVTNDDNAWSTFKTLGNIEKLTFTNTRGKPLKYVPTEALKETTALLKIDIKYGIIETVGSFAFANLSSLEEIILRDNQIVVLDPYAFIHHKNLKVISLDTNNIAEINRNIFVDIPSLERLYLTNNQISTIHDRAFVNLINLKELEIDRNKVFSLNYAVFEGLKNLEKLDLSSNNLEVIGENTFQALENLKSLNLEGNKIEMLDDMAFNGLNKLLSLSLARNKLIEINSNRVFEGLDSLISLSLKENEIKELKNTAMAPILSNFYSNSSMLDVEDNKFPCDCRLDWFTSLMNKTLNKHLRTTIENLKCMPEDSLREAWVKAQEIEKNNQLEENDTQVQEADYEYYDESQLGGKLFYVDVRYLLNCSQNLPDNSATNVTDTLTKENTSPTTSTAISTPLEVTYQDPSDSIVDTTPNENEIIKSEKNKRENNEGPFTTTMLATVSANPIETKIYENMASDEAKPDKIKAHRSIQEERKDSRRIEDSPTNNANKNLGCVMLLELMVLCFRLHY